MKKPFFSRLLILLGMMLLPGLHACDSGSNTAQTKESVREENEAAARQQDAGQATASTFYVGSDAEFLLEAYSYGLMIVEYSQQAVEKAQTPSIKSFAEQSADWHRNLNREIEQRARRGELVLPEAPADDVQKYKEALGKFSAEEFEARYLQVLAKIQKGLMAQFETAASGAGDAKLRAWASETLPKLQAHALTVDELRKQLRNQ